MIKQGFVCIVFVIWIGDLWSQLADKDDVKYMNELVGKFPLSDAESLRRLGEDIIHGGGTSSGCATLAAATYALTRSAILQDDWAQAHWEAGQRDSCVLGFPKVRFVRAVVDFHAERYAEARGHWAFVLAHGEADDRVLAMENIGSCWQREGALDSAQHYYQQALRSQGDDVRPMTINNIASILNNLHRHSEVRPLIDIGLSVPTTDSTALDMLHWNLINAEVMLGNREAAERAMADRRAAGFKDVKDYAITSYWRYVLFMDDFEAFLKHRSGFAEAELAQRVDSAPAYLADLFDDGGQSDVGRLPLSVRWIIAQRTLAFAQEMVAPSNQGSSIAILQEKLERKLDQEQLMNRMLQAGVGLIALAGAVAFGRSMRNKNQREVAAKRLEFKESDHKSILAIREALVNRTGGEEAIAHLADVKELLAARQSRSLDRLLAQTDLTQTEMRLLELIGKSYDANECARMLRCTKSHVYNLRSNIRKKLNLSESVSLKAWLADQMGG